MMRSQVLVVDDVSINRGILSEIMSDEYDVIEASNGKEAIGYLETHFDEVCVVLLDIVMPVMDGFGVLDEMKNRGWIGTLPVLFITGDTSAEVENLGFQRGISDLIRKPYDSMVVKQRVRNIVELYQHKNLLEQKVEAQTQILRNQNNLLTMQARRLEESNTKIIDILGTVVECRSLESGQHIKRVKGFTRIIAGHVMKECPEYGLTEEKVGVIASASALHDIGKIAIPDSILLKPGKFTKEEFECMKTHTTKGWELLENIRDIWDEEYHKTSCDICRYHHERYDGRGYPDALKGEEIPISAQIVSVADVYDALVSRRVYKDAYGKDEAFNMILNGECGVFSQKLMECFRNSKEEFEAFTASL